VQVANVIAQFGAWIWNGIVGAAQAVASAVQAAGKVLGQVLDWVVAYVTNLLKTLFKPVLDAIEQYLASVRATVQAATVELQGTNPSPDEHADRAAQIVTGLLLGGTFLLFLALAIALLTVDVAAKPITALAGLVVPLVTSVAMGLILGAVAVGLFPISNADTGNSPDNVDFIPEFVVDYIPVTAWWDTRAPLTFGRFAITVLIILVRYFVLDDPVGISAIAESMLLSITGLILFVVSPQLQGPAGLVGTGVGFALTLLGFIRVALGARLKTIAPLVYYVALALQLPLWRWEVCRSQDWGDDLTQLTTDQEKRIAELRFRVRYSLVFVLLMFGIGIASLADFLNTFYGTGWDPLEMRKLQTDPTSLAIVVILVAATFVLGIWKTFSAVFARRNLRSQLRE